MWCFFVIYEWQFPQFIHPKLPEEKQLLDYGLFDNNNLKGLTVLPMRGVSFETNDDFVNKQRGWFLQFYPHETEQARPCLSFKEIFQLKHASGYGHHVSTTDAEGTEQDFRVGPNDNCFWYTTLILIMPLIHLVFPKRVNSLYPDPLLSRNPTTDNPMAWNGQHGALVGVLYGSVSLSMEEVPASVSCSHNVFERMCHDRLKKKCTKAKRCERTLLFFYKWRQQNNKQRHDCEAYKGYSATNK